MDIEHVDWLENRSISCIIFALRFLRNHPCLPLTFLFIYRIISDETIVRWISEALVKYDGNEHWNRECYFSFSRDIGHCEVYERCNLITNLYYTFLLITEIIINYNSWKSTLSKYSMHHLIGLDSYETYIIKQFSFHSNSLSSKVDYAGNEVMYL